jgi:hypothetical protein
MTFPINLIGGVLIAGLCSTAIVFANAQAADLSAHGGMITSARAASDLELPPAAQQQFERGILLAKQDKINEAAKIFQSLAQEYPRWPEPHNNLAVLYARQGKYEQARDALIAALDTSPVYSTTFKNLNKIYAEMASLAYQKALEPGKGSVPNSLQLALLETPQPTARVKPAQKPPVKPLPAIAERVIARPAGVMPKNIARGTISKASPAPSKKAKTVARQSTRPVESRTGTRARQEVIETVVRWSKAWSAQNVKSYLGFYDREFKPPRGMSRQAWANQRRTRLKRPRFIKVAIHRPVVNFQGPQRAEITFRQNYNSNTFSSQADKQITLIKRGRHWLIVRERVI